MNSDIRTQMIPNDSNLAQMSLKWPLIEPKSAQTPAKFLAAMQVSVYV